MLLTIRVTGRVVRNSVQPSRTREGTVGARFTDRVAKTSFESFAKVPMPLVVTRSEAVRLFTQEAPSSKLTGANAGADRDCDKRWDSRESFSQLRLER